MPRERNAPAQCRGPASGRHSREAAEAAKATVPTSVRMAPASTAALGETAAVRPAASSGPVMKATSMITASSAYADWSACASSSIAAHRLRMQEEIGGTVRPDSALSAASMADRRVSVRDDDEDAQGRRVDRRRGQQHARLSDVIDQPSLNRHAHSDSHARRRPRRVPRPRRSR